ILLFIFTKIIFYLIVFYSFFFYFTIVLRIAHAYNMLIYYRILNIDNLENLHEAFRLAHAEINIPTIVPGSQNFIEKTRAYIQQRIRSEQISVLNGIQSCYNRLFFLYYRYVGDRKSVV